MIRSLAIAAVLEAIIIFCLILQPTPRTELLRGLPAIEVVTLAPDSEVGISHQAQDDKSDKDAKDEAKESDSAPASAKSTKPLADKTPAEAKIAKGALSTPNTAKAASGPPTHPVSGDRLDRGVVLISGNNPVYPKHAEAYSIESEVKVKILVKSDGSVESVTPIGPEDQWGFFRAVRTAVMNWKFQPGSVSGYSASFYINKSFKFKSD